MLHHWQCLLECKRWFSLVTCIFCIFILLVSLLIFLQSCQLYRSGTSEENDEKDRLLTFVTTSWEDENTHKKEEQTKKQQKKVKSVQSDACHGPSRWESNDVTGKLARNFEWSAAGVSNFIVDRSYHESYSHAQCTSHGCSFRDLEELKRS